MRRRALTRSCAPVRHRTQGRLWSRQADGTVGDGCDRGSMTEPVQPPRSRGPVATVQAARTMIKDLADTWGVARSPQELVATVAALEELRSVLDAVQLQLVAEVEATGAARCEEWASAKDFVTAVGGGRKGDGARAVRLARAL